MKRPTTWPMWAVLGLVAAMVAPVAQAADDEYPPVVPGGNALGIAGYLQHVAGGGDPAEVCTGRFVHRGSCEVRGADVRRLQAVGHTDGVPTGNLDEWHQVMDIRAYDLNADGRLVLERHCEHTWTEGNEVNVVGKAVNHNVVGGWSCSGWFDADASGPMDIRVEVDANGVGMIWVQLSHE